MKRLSLLPTLALFLLPGLTEAQQSSRTQPVTGLRDNPIRLHALTGATVVVAPGQVVQNATVVVRDGVIEAVGPNVPVPAGARAWDMTGLTVYPGFIDAHADLGMDSAPAEGDIGPTHWNPQVRAYYSTSANLEDDPERRAALRSIGFGTALAVPRLGIFRGQAAVIDLSDGNVRQRVLRPDLVQSVAFSRSFQLGGSYPNSPMGAIALMRQTLLDTDWYERAWAAYEASGRSFLPPETSEALAALEPAAKGQQPMLFETVQQEQFFRAAAIQEEFPSIQPWMRGNGTEYQIIDWLQQSDAPLIVPIDFPDAPDITEAEDALDEGFRDLRHWYLAPENPGRLAAAGIEFAITADGLGSEDDFLPNLRAAVRRGLSEDQALAAITTIPASLLGIEGTHGTIAEGKVANLVVTDGDLMANGTSIRDVWVEGEVYAVSIPPRIDPRGTWSVTTDEADPIEGDLVLNGTLNNLRGTLRIGGDDIPLSNVAAQTESGRIQFTFPAEVVDLEGTVQVSASVDDGTLRGWGLFPEGSTANWSGERTAEFDGGGGNAGPALDVPDLGLADIRPAMEYGRTGTPEQPANVIVRNATVWTSGPQGKIEGADLHVSNGQVVAVGQNLTAPAGAIEIDGTGKHVTPGLIDPHIHAGTNGTNESGFAIVPEVRLGDVVTHNNPWAYRGLAGGLTTTHIKHGSANPIGGQNVFTKLRWGSLPEDLKIDNAPRTVKFALGENPKRSPNRYPNTRMGTYQIIKDHFQAARDYEADWAEFQQNGEGIPPRRDLRMEALLDILNQELLISSHGYRADEFLGLVRLAEEFGFRVQTLQHGVEAYKIAPELAAGGVAAVVWSDWSSFKLEAYDATTYNARILLEAGVVTALHSDDSQLSTRMNWEAGKLLRTGVEEEVALQTVTINAAKALLIDDRIGSLEPGKDADFVIWNGHPLSQFTKAEQTWVDGRRYFSLAEDRVLRELVKDERSRLIQLVLQTNN